MVDVALTAGVGSSLIFVVLNVAMNLYTKWLFVPTGGDFAFPWTMLAVQQLQAYMVLQPWIAFKFPAKRWGWSMGEDSSDKFGWQAAMQVLAVTGLFCLNVGLNSLSLVRISITLNQTVRAFLPVGVLVLGTCLEQRTYPRHSYVTTAVLTVGIILTCWGSPDFEFYGFLLALTSTLVAAIGSSLNGRLLTTGPFSVSKAGSERIACLMMLQSVPAFFIFSFIAAWTEWPLLRLALKDLDFWQLHHMLGLISISSMLALMSNLGRCFLVAATSALMETLAGNAKVAALCIIDSQLFQTKLRPYNYLGIAVTFTGFSIHVLLQYSAGRPDRPTEQKVPKLQLGKVNSQQFSLPRVISGAETGLASEHLALRLRRQRRASLKSQGVGGRQRAQTWQAGTDPTVTWLDRVGNRIGMDLAPVIEPPPWLGDEDSLSEISGSGPSLQELPEGLETPGSVQRGLLAKEDNPDPFMMGQELSIHSLHSLNLPGQNSRSRVWSDITYLTSHEHGPL